MRKLGELLKDFYFEKMVVVKDEETDLFAIIILHDTTLGDALGGTRWPPEGYPSFEAAFIDCYKLSRGMTYKSVSYDIKHGGGKAVILTDPRNFSQEQRNQLLIKFARAINKLNGEFVTGKDLGISVEDTKLMAKYSDYIGGSSSDPSPYTSFAAGEGIRAYLEEKQIDFKEITAAVQGVGKTGYYLVKYLKEKGVPEVYVSDIIKENTERCKQEFGVKVVDDRKEIYKVPCYLFAPCAVGDIINDKTISLLKCKLIAGSANNPLLDETKHDQALRKKGIDYLTHYVLNAGGLMSIAFTAWQHDEEYITKSIGQKVYRKVKELIAIRKEHPEKTFKDISDELVERKLAYAKKAEKMHFAV